ncbi:lipopolysaccharide kinase InaA family protein [Entomomonas asaccharolytica]|uniref:Lipopolysaccharide kinase n=1 Tax=Entomomonas asaccharolytica TaxID=2785331 RepID=A0A974RX90_9GAMM|nr:lipopolysaccharide kinase InaA family protein [Entomomonas asaccharolytica]QQP85968.1 lipopolysaccharide kinase [Entomomonas asaccharolytica]
MSVFIASTDEQLLAENGLNSFEALWDIQLENVDEPNSERGGWSTVSYLKLGDRGYFLKRQSNHLTRSLYVPFGEPTFAREFRNIEYYQRLGIPAVTAAFFGTRTLPNEKQAILLTHALDGWQDLESYLPDWFTMAAETQQMIIKACGLLLKKLHDKKVLHGCFYPKHIFLKPSIDGFDSCLIDLEKTRRLHFGKRDRLKDIDTLARRTKNQWREDDYRLFLSAYLDKSKDSLKVTEWLNRLIKRNQRKESRT